MENLFPGKTAAETQQYLADHGHRVAAAQAYRYLGRLIETDPAYPLPQGTEDVIATAATAMQDVYDRRMANLDAYVAARKAALHAAVAEMQPRRSA
jgi:hypothetical protein